MSLLDQISDLSHGQSQSLPGNTHTYLEIGNFDIYCMLVNFQCSSCLDDITILLVKCKIVHFIKQLIHYVCILYVCKYFTYFNIYILVNNSY